MEKKIRSKEKSQEVADKITPIFDLIVELTDEDIDYLKETAKMIEEENSKLSAVAGVMVDYDKAEAKEKAGELGISRIQGLFKVLILIWSAIKGLEGVRQKLLKAQIAQKSIDQMFNL